MEDRLRAHVDELFRDAPNTRKALELREEMVQNLKEKYHDLLDEGRSEEAAYNIAVAGIGDVSELISGLDDEVRPSDSDYERERRRSALLVAGAVFLYILALIPIYMTFAVWYIDRIKSVGFAVFMAAAATGILVYNQMSKRYTKVPKMTMTIADQLQQRMNAQEDRKKLRIAVSIALWTIVITLYFFVSFIFHAWAVSWVLFLLAAAVESLTTIYFMLKK